MIYKVLFMSNLNTSLDALQDIQRMMQRSSRFLSLSGISGIAAGLWGLVGAYFAYDWLYEYGVQAGAGANGSPDFQRLKWNLVLLALGILGVALVSAFYFTWRRASRGNMPFWDRSARLLTGSMALPLATGGILIGMLLLQERGWQLAAPLSLIFYGLALVSGSRYTLSDIRYLGICEIILGLIAVRFPGYGLYFWALGFGVLHLVYGSIMWWKYERRDIASMAKKEAAL